MRNLSLALILSAVMSTAFGQFKWNAPEPLAKGVSLRTGEADLKQADGSTRHLRLVTATINLKTANVGFVATGRAPGWGSPLEEAPTLYDAKGVKHASTTRRVTAETVTSFVSRNAAPKESGGLARPMLLAFPLRDRSRPYSGDFVDPPGLVVSDGVTVVDNPHSAYAPTFILWKDGTAEFAPDVPEARRKDVQVACTTYTFIRKDGQDIIPPTRADLGARLVLGLSADRTTIHLAYADDGQSLQYLHGANYHDMNAVLAELGATDGACVSYSTATAMLATDGKGGFRHVNALGNAPDNQKVSIICGVYATTKAPVASARPKKQPKDKPKEKPKSPEQISARFASSRLQPAVDRSPSELTLKGQVRCTYRSDLPRFKRPLLNVVALFDIDGLWRYCDALMTEQNVHWGACLTREQAPGPISKGQTEVSAEAWSNVIYGNPKIGIFHDYAIPAKAKLLLYRLEVWQNGVLVEAYDSDRSAVRRLNLPADWYIKGKHTDKISYRWPPAK